MKAGLARSGGPARPEALTIDYRAGKRIVHEYLPVAFGEFYSTTGHLQAKFCFWRQSMSAKFDRQLSQPDGMRLVRVSEFQRARTTVRQQLCRYRCAAGDAGHKKAQETSTHCDCFVFLVTFRGQQKNSQQSGNTSSRSGRVCGAAVGQRSLAVYRQGHDHLTGRRRCRRLSCLPIAVTPCQNGKTWHPLSCCRIPAR